MSTGGVRRFNRNLRFGFGVTGVTKPDCSSAGSVARTVAGHLMPINRSLDSVSKVRDEDIAAPRCGSRHILSLVGDIAKILLCADDGGIVAPAPSEGREFTRSMGKGTPG